MIVVGVRVTRISTDGCAVRVQFVVGLHSVPYLFNSNFYQLTLRASNDRVLFFFALVLIPVRAPYGPGGGGGVRRCKHLRCVVAWCSYTVRLHGKVTQCGRVVWLRCGAAGLVRRIVPGALSTGFIHSVENLHACDSVEQR